MANDLYLKIPGLSGESQVNGYQNDFQLLSYSLGVGNTGSTFPVSSDASLSPLQITLKGGYPGASALVADAANGTVLPTVTLYVTTLASGGGKLVEQITLTDATVVAAQQAGDEVAFAFDYKKISIQSYSTNPASGATVPAGPAVTYTVGTSPSSFTAPADAALPSTGAAAFLQVSGDTGPSTTIGYTGDFQPVGYAFSVDNPKGATTGSTSSPLVVDLGVPSSTLGVSTLQADSLINKLIPTVTLDLVKTVSGKTEIYEQVVLTDATVRAVSDAGSDVSVSFDYRSAAITTYTENVTTGAFGNPQTVTIGGTAQCYCPGAMILTDKGEIAVEDLAIGDRVATLHGEARPIKWIGRRSYDGRFVQGQPLMLPVCLKRGAIEENVPARDLQVSPGHAICVDGVLVPAWLLVNDVSITQAASVDSVTYIHIELADHEVIFADGCPAESFIDDNCRNQFQNAAEFHALYPDRDFAHGGLCLPRVEDGFHLQAIQRRLAARAGVKTPSELAGGRLRGFVDQAGPSAVSGWAQDELQPERPVCLDILVDGKRVMRALANRYRADLREAGLGSGKHSFEVQLPAGISGDVEVRRSADQAELALTEAAAAIAA
jgi:type VI protein secretion system component Hcp